MKKVPCIKTVGDLKKALAGIPDDLRLAIDDRGDGWGLKPPFVAEYGWNTGDHNGYVSKDDQIVTNRRPEQAKTKKLARPVCVIQHGTEYH